MNVPHPRERLLELLSDQALVGLDPADEEELARTRVGFPDADMLAQELELAAAALAIASVSEQGLLQMPQGVAMRIEQASAQTAVTQMPAYPPMREDVGQTVVMPWKGVPNLPGPPPYPQPQPQPWSVPPSNVVPLQPVQRAQEKTKGGGRAVAISGWLAAAACLLLAAGTWYMRPRTQVVTVNTPTPPDTTVAPAASAPPVLTPAQERESLLARAGTARLEWTKNAKDPASKQATGDVVWNAAEQRGFMRFRGLAKNDARASVYQLWIFDKNRDDKYPVDGGVFDVDNESGDVIVPIKARLPVFDAALFAVTVEKPGGVVVSKRERIVVTAKPSA